MMRKLVFFIIILSLVGPVLGQTSYDVEYAQVCLIDSIAPDTIIQFWRFTQANNPGEYAVDMTFDLGSSYTVEGTVLPCCSCLTEATAISGAGGGGSIGDIAQSNPAPINALFLLSGAVLLALIIPRRKIAVMLILAAPAAMSAQPGTTYDIEHTCICLVDSIASDTVIQFWRFTQSNNPGEYTVDVTFDMGSSYTVAGTVLSCKDYYLGDNPGGSGTLNTLAMWTGTSSLGNSSVTQSGTIISSSLTGSFRVPTGTNAQEPVWAAGMIRYDTDDAAFEGYQGSEFFFAEAATNNLTSGSVLFSDANGQITQDNSGIFYDTGSDELRLGSNSDRGGYDLQLNGAEGMIIYSAFPAIMIREGTLEFGTSNSANRIDMNPVNTSGAAISISNSNAAGYGIYADGDLTAMFAKTATASYGGVQVANRTTFGGVGVMVKGLEFTVLPTPGGGVSNNTTVGDGFNINWQYTKSDPDGGGALGAYTWDAGRIGVRATNIHHLSPDARMEFSVNRNGTLTEVMRLDSLGRWDLQYGAGSITGTPTYFSAWTSGGAVIERSPANVVADLGIGRGAISTSTDGSGDIVVAHGMGTTPTSVQVTVTGTTPYVVTVHTIGSTNFTVRFYDMAGAAVASTAVTATWLAKT